jgi:hypothetical protein
MEIHLNIVTKIEKQKNVLAGVETIKPTWVMG